MAELLIGCGRKREKLVFLAGKKEWEDLVTLDINPACDPHVVWDLENLPLPFDDERFDEIHAYEVLEHTGRQGDWRFFFAQFADFWRMLKPGGFLMGQSPTRESVWAWGDPGHTRLILPQTFVYLSQEQYDEQVGNTPISDYRFVWDKDFRPAYVQSTPETFSFVLQKYPLES